MISHQKLAPGMQRQNYDTLYFTYNIVLYWSAEQNKESANENDGRQTDTTLFFMFLLKGTEQPATKTWKAWIRGKHGEVTLMTQGTHGAGNYTMMTTHQDQTRTEYNHSWGHTQQPDTQHNNYLHYIIQTKGYIKDTYGAKHMGLRDIQILQAPHYDSVFEVYIVQYLICTVLLLEIAELYFER